jgi:hypothetical protein
MGASKDGTRRMVARLLAALAVGDLAYRMLIRDPVRRSLGIETRHA